MNAPKEKTKSSAQWSGGTLDDALSAKHRLSPLQAIAHSRRVRHLRLITPAAAAALLATYAISATPPTVDPKFALQFSQANVESTSMRLDRPRYLGEDLSGRPFEVAARYADRDPGVPGLVALENPQAFRGIDETENVRVRARSGLMNTDEKRLDLSDDVVMEHEIGGSTFVLNTDAAELDLNANTVHSNVGVSGAGEKGRVKADRATAYQDEGRLVLEGNVRLRFNTQRTGGSGAAGDGLR